MATGTKENIMLKLVVQNGRQDRKMNLKWEIRNALEKANLPVPGEEMIFINIT